MDRVFFEKVAPVFRKKNAVKPESGVPELGGLESGTIERSEDGSRKPVLSLHNVESRHKGALKLRNVDLQVFPGELVTILGANGAGKTSLLGVVCGLYRASQGEIWLEDKLISGLAAYQIARLGLGAAPQNHPIFHSLTVEESLNLGKSNKWLDIWEIFPNLAEKRNMAGSLLSGGERQMLSMAMALLNSPKICLFDEPSSGLAPRIVAQVFQAIRHMADVGITILMVEQNAHAALKIADRAYVMEQGKITMSGTGSDLAADDHVRRAYLGL